MKRAFIIGFGTGLVGAFLSILSNVQRGDPHLVSAYPYLLTLLLVPAGAYWITRQSIAAAEGARHARSLGLEFSVSAATTWGACMAAFSLSWLPSRSLVLATWVFLATLVVSSLVGAGATLAASRRSTTAV